MIEMSLAEIADVVDGVAHGEAVVTGGAFVDTRTPEPGGLFVAVAGERVDGHDFAREAHAAGAVAVLGSRPTEVPTVVVDDVVRALGVLARHVLDRLPDTLVLAMTGSQGKTGTKDYLAHVLGESGETVATRGNFNNEIGVPLTALRATPDTRYLVVEMGARGIGHVAHLCTIAPPTIGAVLNVGTAHIGEFGSREAIARAKGELVAALPADGTAVLNADDPLVAAMAGRTSATVVTFGHDEAADVAVTDVTSDDLGRLSFELVHRGAGATVHLAQVGAHQWRNAAAAAAMALAAGLDLDAVADSLGDAFPASRWRMELAERPTDSSSSTTPTTPIPSRWRPLSRRWPASARAVGVVRSRCSVRCSSWGRGPRPPTPASGPTPQPPGSTSWSRWAPPRTPWPRRTSRRRTPPPPAGLRCARRGVRLLRSGCGTMSRLLMSSW